MLVNVFTPKLGMAATFLSAQTDEYRPLMGRIPGWVGNRLGRGVDGKQLVNVAVFKSLAVYNGWRESTEFAAHLDAIRPFVESAAPGTYKVVYAAGEIP